MNTEISLGALYAGGGKCSFRVWAPKAKQVDVHIMSPHERYIRLRRDDRGYHYLTAEQIKPGTKYKYRLDGENEFPDPASRYQPEGVHGPSEVIDPDFAWTDGCWFGIPLRNFIFYEIHTGAYSAEGTLEGIIPYLDHLVDVGITAIELMPVAQFPGERNWGYDGTFPFAVQDSYGGPDGLRKLVDACHAKGLAIVLDVVYNHVGPEGNYIRNFATYFTDRHKTPWGDAVNFDGANNEGVRRFFIENAIHWIKEFHFDGLRLDAVHAILDFSARPFLEELGVIIRELGDELNRRVYLFPESDLNDVRLIQNRALGGFQLDAQWCDDFHHSLITLLVREKAGYYVDFGRLSDLAKSFREGYVYSGQYSSYRARRHGNSSRELPAERFIVFSQNHDQVGNRMLGERLIEILPFDAVKLTAAAVLLSPYLPLLFMGEEYGETARFPYFISHGDPALVEAVRQGRREEFSEFEWAGEPPDVQSEATFQAAKLNHNLREQGQHARLLEYYRRLIHLRKTIPSLARPDKESMNVERYESARILLVRRWEEQHECICLFHLGEETESASLFFPEGKWRKVLDSCAPEWNGAGSSLPDKIESSGQIRFEIPPFAAILFVKEET